MGQDKWEQHIAHLTEQVDLAPTTVDEMVVQAAGGDARGGLEGHDRLEDVDRGPAR